MQSGLVSKPKRMPFQTPMLPSCAAISMPLPSCKQISGNMFSRDVPHGHQYLQIGQAKIQDTDTQTSHWSIEHVIGTSSEHELKMDQS